MVVLHIDLNSYFATIEQQQNPYLRGKPVGIVKDLGRNCIIAASKEAKAFGIRTGSNVFEGRDLCPNLILVKADFDKYLHYTKRFYGLIASLTPQVSIFSLDEAFLDATHAIGLYRSAERLAENIQNKIHREMGEWVTASIGIAKNRMLAKLAGEYAPKGGYFRIDEDNLDLCLSLAKFEHICGIGPRLTRSLGALGISNPLAIRDLSDRELAKHFGPFWGRELRRISEGDNPHLLELLDANEHMKGVGRTITGFGLCDDERTIRQTVRSLIEEATVKMREMDLCGRQVAIFLEGEDQFWGRHKTLKYYVRHPDEVFNLLYNGLYKGWERSFRVIRFGVRIGLLKPVRELTDCLLPEWEKKKRMWKAVDRINQKYGLGSVRSGTLLDFSVIRPEVTGYLGDKLYQFRNDD